MLFNSFDFLIFFPIVLVVYFILPDRIKYIWLLICSYYFYMCWNAKYALLILFSTIVTYTCGIVLEKIKESNIESNRKTTIKKWTVAISLIINLGILFFYKYSNFALGLVTDVLGLAHITVSVPTVDVLLPVGISFYTFQALGYTIDVYREEIYAEKNFFRYALFVSFFPQLVAGPIERSKNLLKQLAEPKKFNFENAREGFLLMLWGYFLKLVIADRIAIFVDTVYNNFGQFPGCYFVVAALLFIIQVYGDFAGYSTIAMGSAKVLGIDLMDNFDAPFLATSIAKFWRRWHISLSSWFLDYLYIPLGGSRKGKLRKYFNIMIVFLVSGLWHGANLTYVVWGGLNGLYQVIGDILMPIRKGLKKILGVTEDSFPDRLIHIIGTFVLFAISMIFFRASSIGEGIAVFKSIITVYNPWILFDGSIYNCGLDMANFGILIFGLQILLFADICKVKGIKIREVVVAQNCWFRWIFIASAISFIMTFGVWGSTYNAANFIYFQF